VMKRSKLRFILTAILGLVVAAYLAGCGGGASQDQGSGELQTVRVGMSAFQDVNTLYVGIEKGFFEEEGIEFDIQRTDWPGANELLTGSQVDIATSSDADVILQNAQGHKTTLAFPLYYFAGGGLMYDPDKHNWKTFEQIKEETGGDNKEAIRETLEQLKGKKVGVSAGGGEYATFVGLIDYAGLSADDFQIVDLAQEELPPALLSGSIDVMISGIPQRLAVLDEGYETLIDQTALPSTIVHAGFAAQRDWVDENPELAAGLQKGIFRTLAYIEKNPDEAFPIISEELRKSGTEMSTEELKGVWNNMEFFPSSKEEYQQQVLQPDGRFYWKDRFQAVVTDLKATGKIDDVPVSLEQLNYGPKVVKSIK
jgi:NitT/TauT family transport system substrate-binding protein